MNWFWLDIPLMVLFICCWAGIPLWHTLTRWDAELKAKHAGIAAGAVAAPVFVPSAPAPAAAHGVGRLAYAGVACAGRVNSARESGWPSEACAAARRVWRFAVDWQMA